MGLPEVLVRFIPFYRHIDDTNLGNSSSNVRFPASQPILATYVRVDEHYVNLNQKETQRIACDFQDKQLRKIFR
jgi:hypothetical protein